MKIIENIEDEFNKVVIKAGGDLVINKLETKSPDFLNADYIFQKDNIIAELKILEKNPDEDSALQNKIQATFDKWIKKKEIAILGTVNVNSKDLPQKMQWELHRIYSEPVRRVIKKANKQIRETKEYFKMNNAFGLVIVVNNANYSLNPEQFAFAAHQSLNSDFSSINGVSLLTINLNAKLSNDPTDYKVWIDYSRNSDKINSSFLLKLRSEWLKHYSLLVGETLPEVELNDFNSLKNIKK